MAKIIYKIVMLICLFWGNTVVAMDMNTDDDQEPSMREKVWHYMVNGASISAGIGARVISLDVKRIGTENKGKLVDKDENAFFLSYNLKANYFDHSNIGYSWMFNISSFELDQQEVLPEVTKDMGTHVQGHFAYAVPAFFYNFGNKHQGSHLRLGFGIGLGIAEFQGDIILTDSTKKNDRADISNGPSNVFVAGGLFIEGQWGYFTARFATAGPSLEYNGYEIKIADSSIMLGVTYPLEN